jgi:predicted AAA+ superfamily ATPase
MMAYRRKEYEELRRRLLAGGGFIQLITGPRQVGKTTLVKQLFTSDELVGVYVVAKMAMIPQY